MARRASLHSARTASVAAKDFLNSPRVERRNLATAIANRSVMAAYTVMSRIFSAQTIPYEDKPEAKETAASAQRPAISDIWPPAATGRPGGKSGEGKPGETGDPGDPPHCREFKPGFVA
jgi:hypothetical protein